MLGREISFDKPEGLLNRMFRYSGWKMGEVGRKIKFRHMAAVSKAKIWIDMTKYLARKKILYNYLHHRQQYYSTTTNNNNNNSNNDNNNTNRNRNIKNNKSNRNGLYYFDENVETEKMKERLEMIFKTKRNSILKILDPKYRGLSKSSRMLRMKRTRDQRNQRREKRKTKQLGEEERNQRRIAFVQAKQQQQL